MYQALSPIFQAPVNEATLPLYLFGGSIVSTYLLISSLMFKVDVVKLWLEIDVYVLFGTYATWYRDKCTVIRLIKRCTRAFLFNKCEK